MDASVLSRLVLRLPISLPLLALTRLCVSLVVSLLDHTMISKHRKRWIAYAFLSGLIVLIVVVYLGRYLDIGASQKQMNDAKKIMDSLTDKDIQALIQRTQTILREDASVEFTNRDVPPDLKHFGIAGIEEQKNEVDYVWFGGMDNTALDVVRMSNGTFQVFAVYTPYSNRMIWPKR